MYRPIAKYVVRVVLFASTLAAIACASPTAPTSPVAKKAVKDSVPPTCRSGFTLINGRYVCNEE
jgi:hypothetical protein